MAGFAGPRPPSTTQILLTRLRGSIAEVAQELQETLQKARVGHRPLDEDGPTIEYFNAAADHLNTAQHLATALATPLEMAEQFLLQFKAAVEHNPQDASGATSSGLGPGVSQASPFERLQALINQHTQDAAQAEANAIEAHSWTADIARHYRLRAEMLESSCVHNGDERAVLNLLEADLELTKTTFTDESRSGPHLSGESQAHRVAMNRYAH
eukprot:g10158.t1